MVTYNPEAIGALIVINGKWIPPGDEKSIVKFLDTAIAVALAESGGDSKAISPTGDYGLWQINKKAHPTLIASGDWSDGKANTEMARKVWKDAGGSFSPWSTYKSQNGQPPAYMKHLGHGQRVYDLAKDQIKTGGNSTSFLQAALLGVGLTPGPNGGNPAAGVLGNALGLGDVINNPLDKVTGVVSGALKSFFEWATAALATIGLSILALLLLGLGVWFLVSQTQAGKAAKSAALTAATKGAVS